MLGLFRIDRSNHLKTVDVFNPHLALVDDHDFVDLWIV